MIEEAIQQTEVAVDTNPGSQTFADLARRAKDIAAVKYAEWRNVMMDYKGPAVWGENFRGKQEFQLQELHQFGHAFAHEFVGNILGGRQAAKDIRSALDGFFRENFGAQIGDEWAVSVSQEALITQIPQEYQYIYHDLTGIITTYAQDKTFQGPPERIIFSTPDDLVDKDYLPREYSPDTFLCIYGSDHSLPPSALSSGPDMPQVLHQAGAVYFAHSPRHPIDAMDGILLAAQYPKVPGQNISLISHVNFALKNIGRIFIGDRTGVRIASIADNHENRTQIIHLGNDYFGYGIPDRDARDDPRIPQKDLRKTVRNTEKKTSKDAPVNLSSD